MPNNDTKNYGLVIQLNWPISSYTRDLIEILTKSGITIDIITTKRSHIPYLNISEVNANLITLLEKNHHTYNIIWKVWRTLSIIFFPIIHPVDPILRHVFKKEVRHKEYDFIIAIEKESLILSTDLLRKSGSRIYYWSLELYNRGYPSYFKYKPLNENSLLAYKHLSGYFIQDRLRWSVIKGESPINIKPFYLPICAYGAPIRTNKFTLREKHGIPQKIKTILIAHGNIAEDRGLVDMIEMAQALDHETIIIVHGNLLTSINKDLPKNLVINTQLFNEDELLEFISMADIGLALYNGKSDNDRLIAFSSHKLALYARCSIPYIAYHNESFDLLDEAMHWGIAMKKGESILTVVNKIRDNYSYYKLQAQKAYLQIYNFNAYKEDLVNYING